MLYIGHTQSVMLIADEGKLLRAVNDVYEPAYIDEEGNQIKEHIPYRTDVIRLPKSVTEEQARTMYVEEDSSDK